VSKVPSTGRMVILHRMQKALKWLVGVALLGVGKWAFDNIAWDAFIQLLETKVGIKEADIMTSVLSVIVPIALAVVASMTLYGVAWREYEAKGVSSSFNERSPVTSWKSRLAHICSHTAFQVVFLMLVAGVIAGILGPKARLWGSSAGDPSVITIKFPKFANYSPQDHFGINVYYQNTGKQ
jgi:hypothetical protein